MTDETEITLTQDSSGAAGNTTITNPPNMYVQGSLLGPPAGTTKAFTGGGRGILYTDITTASTNRNTNIYTNTYTYKHTTKHTKIITP